MRSERHSVSDDLPRSDSGLPSRLAELLILCARIGFNP